MNTFKNTGLASSQKEMKMNDTRNPLKEKNDSSLPSVQLPITLVCDEEMKKLEERILDFFVQMKKERCLVVIENQIIPLCPSPPKIKKALENLEKQGRIMKNNRGWCLK